MDRSRNCSAINHGCNLFEFSFGGSRCVVVDLNNKSCSCRTWNLTGVPCSHAIRCILLQNEDLVTYVHMFLSLISWNIDQFWTLYLAKIFGNKVSFMIPIAHLSHTKIGKPRHACANSSIFYFYKGKKME